MDNQLSSSFVCVDEPEVHQKHETVLFKEMAGVYNVERIFQTVASTEIVEWHVVWNRQRVEPLRYHPGPTPIVGFGFNAWPCSGPYLSRIFNALNRVREPIRSSL